MNFSVKLPTVAKIKIKSHIAHWVAKENWHPNLTGSYQDDGCYYLEIPYGHSKEIIMDIVRFGSDAEVLAPESLKLEVIDYLEKMLVAYNNTIRPSAYEREDV